MKPKHLRLARFWPVPLVLLAFAAGWIGSGLHVPWTTDQTHIRFEIRGVVTSVNHDASALCVRADSDGQTYCSVPFQLRGANALGVGDHVVVEDLVVPTASGSSVEIFVVVSPLPSAVP